MLSNNFDVRKLAARMEDNKEDYYILCGWMAEDDCRKILKRKWRTTTKYSLWSKMTMTPTSESPPPSWRIPKLFKPFEMFVQMYGLPAHNEMDPTIFVGITYSLFSA